MEQYYAHDLGNGKAGKGFYEQLLSAVRAAGSPEAIKEFETRLFPFLNPHQKQLNAGDVGHLEGITDPEVTTAVQDLPRRESGRVFALYLAAFLRCVHHWVYRYRNDRDRAVNYVRSFDTSREGGGIRIWIDDPADASRWRQGSGTRNNAPCC
jgi:hypothetical protein